MAKRRAKLEAAPITPLRLSRSIQTLVVYGGSFDPPHEYHLNACHLGTSIFGTKHVATLYVPAARNPLKPAGPFASDEHRVAMLLAGERENKRNEIDGVPGGVWGVWTDEIDRARWYSERGEPQVPSYTIDTVRRLRSILPSRVTLRLLIGSDQALAFHKWKEWRALLREAEPLVALRDPAPTPKALVEQLDPMVWSLRERLAWAVRIAPYPARLYSSTQIRRLLPRQPLAYSKWSDDAKMVTKEVAQYIIKHRLYGVGTKCVPTRVGVPPRSARGGRAKVRGK